MAAGGERLVGSTESSLREWSLVYNDLQYISGEKRKITGKLYK